MNPPGPPPRSGYYPVLETLNRRRLLRYSCGPEIACRFARIGTGESFAQAQARDISTEGITLILPHWLGQGTVLRVDLRNTATNISQLLFASVMHATLRAEGDWLVGCAFLDKLSSEKIRDLVPEPAA